VKYRLPLFLQAATYHNFFFFFFEFPRALNDVFLLHFQMPDASAQQREFWSSFQLSAASLTQFYKSAIESVELIHQQNHQQQNRTAAAAPPLVSPMQCSACSQKVTWCQNCNTYTPTNPGGGRLAATAAATSPEASGKKSPPGSPFQHQATAAAMVEQSNRLKRTREMASAADDSDYFPESMFIKRFRRNHDHPDIV
jgi:hypothetical protein